LAQPVQLFIAREAIFANTTILSLGWYVYWQPEITLKISQRLASSHWLYAGIDNSGFAQCCTGCPFKRLRPSFTFSCC